MSEDSLAQLAGFRAGSLLAGYRLEAQVGAGGMAVVFRARDERLGRLVALKILVPALTADSVFRRRFIAESRAAAAVDDPHIIPVYEAGEADGALFIAMRFVLGGDLRRVLEQEGALAPGRAAGFISPVASALDAAHRAGLVHRDVKPANILVDARPDRPDHVYLSDFGVSKGAASSVSLTGAGQFLGTPAYSAPEQIQGWEVDGQADQYALACVAYQMLTGEVPFKRDQGMAVLLAHLSEPPPSLSARRPDLPGAAGGVLARAMAKAPERRYGSCRDFADALREALGLASYHPGRPAFAPSHLPAKIVSPPPEFPVTETVPSPANSTAGQTGAEPDTDPAAPAGDGGQRATWPPRDDQVRGATGGPGPGPDEKTPPAPRPRGGGRAIRRRLVIVGIAAISIAAVGLVTAITTIFGTPNASVSGTPRASVSGTPRTAARWFYTTGGLVSGPAVSGGTVYVGSDDDKVYALDAATGHLRWFYTTGGSVDSTPAVSGGTVYVGSDDDKVYALDAATGHLRWFYTTGGSVSDPAVSGGTVYVGSDDDKVYALDAATGHLRWFYTTGGSVSGPAVSGGTVYVGSWDDKVYALDAATGHLRWAYVTGGLVSGPAVSGGTVYVGSADGKVYALDTATGHLLWSHTTGNEVIYGPAVSGGTVYVGSADDKVYALDAATGHLLWSYTIVGPVDSTPAVSGGIVYAGSYDGKVYALDAATGHLRWSYTTGPANITGYIVSSGQAVSGGTVYIGNDSDKVYALSAPASSKPTAGQPGVTPSCTGGTGMISFVNLSLTTPLVDVYLYSSSNTSGRLVQHDLGYGTASSYLRVSACHYSVKIRIAASPAFSKPVLSASITVLAGSAYTVAAEARQLKILDDILVTPTGRSLVRVIQASLSQAKVTLHCSCAPGAPGNITTDASSGSVTPYVPMPAGTWTMTATGPSATASLTVTLRVGSIYEEIVIDGPRGIEIRQLEAGAS